MRWWLPLGVLFVSSAALAQSKSEADARAADAASNLKYESAIKDYRSYSGQSIQPWRDSNDNVGRIGGWREYAKEGRASATGKPAGDGKTPTPAKTDSHDGHHGGKK